MNRYIRSQINESIKVKRSLLENNDILGEVERISAEIVNAFRSGQKVLIAGNGGSAADAQHMTAEFVSKFYVDRKALPAIALTVDTSIITSVGNDYGFEDIFSRQIEALANEGDIVIGISTSGKSKNILKLLEVANHMNLITILLTGSKVKDDIRNACSHCISIPSDDTPRIQESHILLEHIICATVEETLYGKN